MAMSYESMSQIVYFKIRFPHKDTLTNYIMHTSFPRWLKTGFIAGLIYIFSCQTHESLTNSNMILILMNSKSYSNSS